MMTPEEVAEVLGRPRPTPQQAEVIAAPLAPTLVVAGAGSGKTETIAQRVVYLVANGLAQPQEILGLTFTRKAAGELATRLRARLRAVAAADGIDADIARRIATGQPEIGTYHAFAGRIIAEFGPLVGIDSTSTVLTPTATWQLARRVVARWDGDLDTDRTAERVTQDVLDISSALADHLVTVESLDEELDRIMTALRDGAPSARQRGAIHSGIKGPLAALTERRAVLPLVRAFVAAKRAANVIDFADQIQLAARIVGASARAGAELRTRFPLVFLDEYQDTGHSQRVILRGLFGDPTEGSGTAAAWRGHAVTAVGDPVQSIYSWRGASAANLPRFVTDFPLADGSPAHRRSLLVSFRNDRRILDVANTISEPVRRAPVAVGMLGAAGTADDGTVSVALLPTALDENHWLADKLDELWTEGSTPPTVAVLVRRRAGMAAVARALRDRGLPVEVVGVGGLVDEPEIADIIAMLRMMVDYGSGPAAVRILTGARWRLGISDLAALSRRARELNADRTGAARVVGPTTGALAVLRTALADAMGGQELDEAGLVDAIADPGDPGAYTADAWHRIGALRDELRRLRRQLNAPLGELVREIERSLRLDIEVLLTADGRAHLDAFADIVATLAADGAGPLELLDYLATAAEREDGLAPGEVDVAQGRIQILTIHAAKGLEWDVVAVPHLVDGVFPSSIDSTWLGDATELPPALRGDRDDLPGLDLPAGGDQGDMAAAVKHHRTRWRERHLTEERRLLYVAVTRARHRLILSAHHWGATRKKPAGPGEFFRELTDGGSGGEPPSIPLDVDAPPPAAGDTNPLLDQPLTAIWPVDPLGATRSRVTAGAARVRDLMARTDDDGSAFGFASDEDVEADGGDLSRWWSDARTLLAERAAATVAQHTVDVDLPPVLTVSSLVDLADDPAALARRLHRPVPLAPSPRAHRGTEFHSWLERYFGGEALWDVSDLPGAHDEGSADDPPLQDLIDSFRRSPWARRSPIAIEVPFVTPVAGLALRGRIDAVFAEVDGSATVVDWKTGAVPTGDRARSVALQLIAYRLAWSRLSGLPLDRVHAAFHYVAHDRTVTPADLMDDAALAALIAECTTTANTDPGRRSGRSATAPNHGTIDR